MKELNENELDQISGGNVFYNPLSTKCQATRIGKKCPHPTQYDTCNKKCFYYDHDKIFGDTYCNWLAHH